MKCEKCGSKLQERSKHSGEKDGFRYWVCSQWPECNYKKGYAEEGKEHKWTLKDGKISQEGNKEYQWRKSTIKLKLDASNPIANMIRFMAIIVIAASFIFKVDLTKLIFKKTAEEMKGPNITEVMTTEQYAEVLKIINAPIIEKVQEVQPPINNEKETALTIYEGNRIFVPVTIGYRGKMVTVPLLIDTGATGVTISPAIAQRLGIRSEETTQGESTVADGRKVTHYNINVAFVAVGPKIKNPLQIHILPNANNEEAGLLGMSFLADFPHMIDVKSQVIRWM